VILRNLLSKLKWKKENAIIEIIHREGKKELIKRIELKDVTYIGKGHFEYGKNETYIPFHRIKRIVKDGLIIWEKSGD